jgi:RNA polymerase sigma-70 factor (ECF subfamily)
MEVKPLNKKDTAKQFEEEYLAKILGFCYQKVNSREDAEDLSSEIALEVVKAINSGKEIENLGAFIWSVSNHTFFKWLRSKKYGTTVYLDELFVSPDNTEENLIRWEAENILHREISLLSENYRKATVLYYFEEKSCNEIAAILGKSVGTVKWWLHNARNSIKEGFDIMREYGEKSYNPGTLFLSCTGLPGKDNEPMSCAKRKLPQNILLAAYKEPVSIEQLCAELGTAAAYIEDEVKSLTANQLMKEIVAGKFQTDFVILPGQNTEMAHKIYNACFPDYYNALIDFFNARKSVLTSEKFNTANFSWNRLLWVYLHIVTDIAVSKFRHEVCKAVCYNDIPERPNGGKWIALGFNNGWFFDSRKNESKWKEYIPFDGPVHKTGKDFAQGFFHYWSGLDSNVFFDIPDGVFALCREIIKGNILPEKLNEDQKYLFSIAIEKKLFIKEGDNFKQNYYFIRHGELKQIEQLAYEFYPVAQEFFNKAYKLVLDEYKTTVPKHLHWQMGNFLSNHLGNFVTCSLYEGVRSGILSTPDESNKDWLSLFTAE